MSNLSNREFYQLHGGLTRERVEWLLDLEDAARNLVHMRAACGKVFDDDVAALSDVLNRVPLE